MSMGPLGAWMTSRILCRVTGYAVAEVGAAGINHLDLLKASGGFLHRTAAAPVCRRE